MFGLQPKADIPPGGSGDADVLGGYPDQARGTALRGSTPDQTFLENDSAMRLKSGANFLCCVTCQRNDACNVAHWF